MRSAINLSGLNLDVANAAARSGFDTINQAALHDLIWAVRCVALKQPAVSENRRPRPPSQPIYPGRYRPSGAGDNTKRKKRGEDQTYIEVGTIASMLEQQRRQEGNVAPVAKKAKNLAGEPVAVAEYGENKGLGPIRDTQLFRDLHSVIQDLTPILEAANQCQTMVRDAFEEHKELQEPKLRGHLESLAERPRQTQLGADSAMHDLQIVIRVSREICSNIFESPELNV